MPQISISVNGEQQLSRNLRLLSENIDDMSEFTSGAVDIIEKRTNKIFQSQWSIVQKAPTRKPHAASTRKARAKRRWYYKKSPSRPGLLRWTWNLQNSIKKESSSKSWRVRFDADYAVYHQDGGKNLPKRALIDLDNRTNADIVRTLQTVINQAIGVFNRQL